MVSKKVKELRDELRSESSASEIARLKSEITQTATREREEFQAKGIDPNKSFGMSKNASGTDEFGKPITEANFGLSQEDFERAQKQPTLTKDERTAAEVEKRVQERETERELGIAEEEIVEELPPEEEAVQELPPEPLTYTDPETGVTTPLHSGGVTPVTASDLTDVITLFTGLGLAKVGGKTVAKKLAKETIKKGGLIGENVAKKSMLNVIKNKGKAVLKKSGNFLVKNSQALIVGLGIGAAGQLLAPFVGGKITAPDRIMRSLDTELSQIRESITLPVSLATAGLPSDEALEMVDDYRDDILESNEKVKLAEIHSQEMRTNPEFSAAYWKRSQKLVGFLDLAERQLIQMQVTGRVPTTEELANLMETYEAILGE